MPDRNGQRLAGREQELARCQRTRNGQGRRGDRAALELLSHLARVDRNGRLADGRDQQEGEREDQRHRSVIVVVRVFPLMVTLPLIQRSFFRPPEPGGNSTVEATVLPPPRPDVRPPGKTSPAKGAHVLQASSEISVAIVVVVPGLPFWLMSISI